MKIIFFFFNQSINQSKIKSFPSFDQRINQRDFLKQNLPKPFCRLRQRCDFFSWQDFFFRTKKFFLGTWFFFAKIGFLTKKKKKKKKMAGVFADFTITETLFIVAVPFVALGLLSSGYSIFAHLFDYKRPSLQR